MRLARLCGLYACFWLFVPLNIFEGAVISAPILSVVAPRPTCTFHVLSAPSEGAGHQVIAAKNVRPSKSLALLTPVSVVVLLLSLALYVFHEPLTGLLRSNSPPVGLVDGSSS